MMLFWREMTVERMLSGEQDARRNWKCWFSFPILGNQIQNWMSDWQHLFSLCFFFQVLGNWSPVFLSGDSAHPLWEHPRTGPQAATILSELCGDHAQRSRRGEDWDPRVSTPISREEVELHNCQWQLGHLRTRARQRWARCHVFGESKDHSGIASEILINPLWTSCCVIKFHVKWAGGDRTEFHKEANGRGKKKIWGTGPYPSFSNLMQRHLVETRRNVNLLIGLTSKSVALWCKVMGCRAVSECSHGWRWFLRVGQSLLMPLWDKMKIKSWGTHPESMVLTIGLWIWHIKTNSDMGHWKTWDKTSLIAPIYTNVLSQVVECSDVWVLDSWYHLFFSPISEQGPISAHKNCFILLCPCSTPSQSSLGLHLIT